MSDCWRFIEGFFESVLYKRAMKWKKKRTSSTENPKKTTVSRLIFFGCFVAFSFATAYLIHLDEEVKKRFEGERWKRPSKIYSAPLKLRTGLDIHKANLGARLKRLAYHRVDSPVTQRGEYRQSSREMEIYLHPFDYPEHTEPGRRLQISLSETGHIQHIKDLSSTPEQNTALNVALGQSLKRPMIEPEVIGGFYESEWEERRLIRLEEIPQILIDAVLVVEDRKFFSHPGIDIKSIVRAIWVNLWAGKIVQGGSTLTQQLVKNFYLDSEKTWERKGREAMMALLLEWNFSKEQILETYFNEIYLGQNGIMGIYGIGQASWFYFEKDAIDLSLGEAALLAGMIRSPNLYSPVKDVYRSIHRRNLILESLFSEGVITRSAYLSARKEKVSVKKIKQGLNTAPYFIDQIRRQLAGDYPDRILNASGLRIFTTLDIALQRSAEKAVQNGLETLERNNPRLKRFAPEQELQGALVAIDPLTGAVKALVGGRFYKKSQFNRVTDARRQPGSLFKPIVYLTAFDEAAKGGRPYTPISEVDDAPLTIEVGGKTWSPQNYDRSYLGPLTLRTALARSRNTATVRLSQELGIDAIVDVAQKIGIQSPLKPVASLALGSIEVSPLEMGMAYATLANGGIRHSPKFLSGIIDPNGLPIEREVDNDARSSRVISAEASYLVTHLMKGVINSGTAQGVRQLGFKGTAAGKTGTTSGLRDAWFAGYTPELVTVVWVGFDQNQSGEFTGATAALPIWTDFMKQAALSESSEFQVPDGIIFKKVNQQGIVCEQDGIEEPFIAGTEPTQSCEKGILKWIKRFFF